MKFINRPIIAFVFILLTVCGFSSIEVRAQSGAATTEWLIEYGDVQHSLAEEPSVEGVETIEQIAPKVELWSFAEDADIEQITQQLREDSTVLSVEPNYERHLHAESDPFVEKQWWIPHLQPETLWSSVKRQKKAIVVAVIDSGISSTHEDLQGRIQSGGYNFYGNNTNVEDMNGHGTGVAGVIAATYGNGKGITGVAGPYHIKVLPLKVSHITGTSYVSDSIKAIDYAIEKKVDVINMSLGSAERSTTENAAVQRAIRAGIVVVASAGNEALKGNPISYPASYENVISVGAIDIENRRSSFSNYNSSVSLVAPGTGIYTTGVANSYKSVNGTSFSSPIVAGAAAMIKSLQPDATPKQIKNILEDTAVDLGEPGKDPHFGAGLLNLERVYAALAVPEVKVQTVELDKASVTLDMNVRTSYSNEEKTIEAKRVHAQAAMVYEEELLPEFAMDHMFMQVGQSKQWATGIESNASIMSSNRQVATVDEYGIVHATGWGSATIRYESKYTVKELRVKVGWDTDRPMTALFENVLPIDAVDRSVTWTSSNPEVAEVDKYGIITGKKTGGTIITVRTNDGGLTADAKVTVVGGQTQVEFVGDFPAMTVNQHKVFTIHFNQKIQVGRDYSKDIFLSRSPDGSEQVNTFLVFSNPNSSNQLLIMPETEWKEGTYYLTITKNLQNDRFVSLKKDVRMKFDVVIEDEPVAQKYVFESNYDFDWEYIKRDYREFQLNGVKNGKIVAGYTTNVNNNFRFAGNIGDTRNEIIRKYGQPLTYIMKDRTKYNISGQDLKPTYMIDGKYVTFLIDQHNQNRVRSILWIDQATEERAKYWYKTPNERYKQHSEQLMHELVNQARHAAGLPILNENKLLTTAARMHSEDMARNNYFSHTNLRGESASQRVENIGLRPNATGENIAQGYLNSILAHEGLMNSLGHRNNILSPEYSQLGIGIAFNSESKPYITQKFYIYK
ncbi:hypothetical protein DV702_00190 [Sporosarcina sp. PTS2304]|uniref:S8 family serine peptidase n=1 Tax=Sporosarcina sp. PTS2304 TaxID=2283194 RepID=UPI000E0D1421|nr:S8 family serine peptidase [Sporosarcina sp. PTS2304]AXH98255.1 hypothetical protein DV702_00190 [Sporosarcina sp. PTS2304]